MSTKVDHLRHELDALIVKEWVSGGDEGLILIRATKEQRETTELLAKEFPAEIALTDVAVVVAERFCEMLEQQGMRPADFWRMSSLAESVAKQMSKALAENPAEFSGAFLATLKGRG